MDIFNTSHVRVHYFAVDFCFLLIPVLFTVIFIRAHSCTALTLSSKLPLLQSNQLGNYLVFIRIFTICRYLGRCFCLVGTNGRLLQITQNNTRRKQQVTKVDQSNPINNVHVLPRRWLIEDNTVGVLFRNADSASTLTSFY